MGNGRERSKRETFMEKKEYNLYKFGFNHLCDCTKKHEALSDQVHLMVNFFCALNGKFFLVNDKIDTYLRLG